MHVFDMRQDVATLRLADSVPNTSTLGLWLVFIPLWVKYKLSGAYFVYPQVPDEGREGLSDFLLARTLYIDRITRRAVGDIGSIRLAGAQVTTPGPTASLRETGSPIFELDQARTQELKVASLGNAGIDATHVTFVPVDFSRDDAFENLRAAGYDPTKKTLFIWEGVTLYLAEEDVRRDPPRRPGARRSGKCDRRRLLR